MYTVSPWYIQATWTNATKSCTRCDPRVVDGKLRIMTTPRTFGIQIGGEWEAARGAMRPEACACLDADAYNLTFSTDCACFTGTYLNSNRTRNMLASDSGAICAPCSTFESGKYRTTHDVDLTRGAMSFMACNRCKPEYYGVEDARVACRKCPIKSGTQNRSDARRVTDCKCAAGYFMNNGICQKCPKWSSSRNGQRDILGCQCDSEHWMDVRTGACLPCPKSRRSVGSGSTSPRHCTCLMSSPAGQCYCGRGMYLVGTGLDARCNKCPHNRTTTTANARDVKECTMCPEDTYGPVDHKKPCILCGSMTLFETTTNGKLGQTSLSSCIYCVGSLCGGDLTAASICLISLLVLTSLRYCALNLPPRPRLPVVAREAFLLGIGKYAHYANLPGALGDLIRMYVALSDAGFHICMYSDVEYSKSLKKAERDGNIMQLFAKWCGSIRTKVDALVYYCGHGIHFQGTKWLVPGFARISAGPHVLFQCTQLDYLRITLANASPRVTIFSLDCCDSPIRDTFVTKPVWKKASDSLPESYKLVDTSQLNQSSGALNVYIFHGTASQTKAKELKIGNKAYGAFTTAFVKHMGAHNRTLDELSQMIRTEMASRIDDMADTDDHSMKQPRQRMQISPTENYLQHAFRGWCFHSSPFMCGGLVSAQVEDCMRGVINCQCLRGSGSVGQHGSAAEDDASSSDSDIVLPATDRSAAMEMQPTPQHMDRRVTITAHTLEDRVVWKEYKDAQGRAYYYNTESKATQWARPTSLGESSADNQA